MRKRPQRPDRVKPDQSERQKPEAGGSRRHKPEPARRSEHVYGVLPVLEFEFVRAACRKDHHQLRGRVSPFMEIFEKARERGCSLDGPARHGSLK